VIIKEKYDIKKKKMDRDGDALSKCQEAHKNDVHKLASDFNYRLDEITDSLDEIKTEQLRTSLYVAQLQSDVQKHNNVIERTYQLETDVAVIKERVGVANG
jgi:uncharacterized protein YicC (UPF0701 family)